MLLGEWPVCLGNLVGRCKKTSLSRGRLVPAASPSVAEVAPLKTTPSASPSNLESKMARAVVSIAASLFVAFYKAEWARGRQTALEKSTFQPLCLLMHLLKQHWSSFFWRPDLITVVSYHKLLLMGNALSKPSPALVVEWHRVEAGAVLLEQNCWALPPSPPPPPLQRPSSPEILERGVSPWVTSLSNWRLQNCRDANALHCNLSSWDAVTLVWSLSVWSSNRKLHKISSRALHRYKAAHMYHIQKKFDF